jgi:peptide/nickel transport system substrate-binding protein
MRARCVGRKGRPASLRMLALGTALTLVASGCTLGSASEPSGSERPALFGGTLRLALVAKPSQLDDPAILDPARPYNVFGRIDPELMRCCLVRTLLSYSGLATEEGGTELRPDLASGMPEVSRDGLTWTFRLKQGIHYAPPLEELEITAADVARGIRRTAVADVSPGGEEGGRYSTYHSVIQGYDGFAQGETDTISGLEVVDDHTLRVHLTEVTNDFGHRLALPGSAPIPPSPRDARAALGVAKGHDEGYGPYLVASGPYMVQGAAQLDPSKPPAEQSPVRGLTLESLILVRNPSWDRSTDDLRVAYVDRIELHAMRQAEAERGIDEGTVDGLFDAVNSSAQVDRYLADPELASRVLRGTYDFFISYTAMNLAVPPFDDVQVRRAVNLAYDAERWTRVANRYLQNGFQMGTIVGHLAPDGTQAALLRGYRPYPFDLEAAHEEMARSRYDEDGDGVCDHPACGDVFALETGYGFEWFSDRVWLDGLRKIGITLNIRHITWRHLDRYIEMSRDPSLKVALNLGTYWQADYPNASAWGTIFTAEGIDGPYFGNVSLVGARPGQLERWGYGVTEVPDVDATVARCLSLIGFAQTRCWAELDQQLMADVVPWVPQNTLDFVGIIPDRIVRASVDQATGAWLALDHVALSPAGS